MAGPGRRRSVVEEETALADDQGVQQETDDEVRTVVKRLNLDQVVEMNRDECAWTSENHVLLDEAGLEAAVERPWAACSRSLPRIRPSA